MIQILFSGFKIHSLLLSFLHSNWKKRSLPEKVNSQPKYYLTKSETNNLQRIKSLHYRRYELN